MTDLTSSRHQAKIAGERLLAEHLSGDPFAAAFKATRMPMIITDPCQDDNPIIFANQAFCALSGYDIEELIGRNCRLLQGAETDMESVKKIQQAVIAEENISIDILNYRKDGTQFWNALFISPVRNAEGDVIYFFASQVDVSNLKHKEVSLAAAREAAEREAAERTSELQRALDAKTFLIHEVDHRVKNNLLTIASILKLQARMSDDEIVRKTLFSVLQKVEALSTVQRRLFTTDDITRFDISEFTRELATNMAGPHQRKGITLELDLPQLLIPAVKGNPLALIINELVADAVKRSLKSNGTKVAVAIHQQDGNCVVKVMDDVPSSMPAQEQDAFSDLILETCARQVGARIDRVFVDHRMTVTVTLPIELISESAKS